MGLVHFPTPFKEFLMFDYFLLVLFFLITVLFVATAIGGVIVGSLILALSCSLLAGASFLVLTTLLSIVRG